VYVVELAGPARRTFEQAEAALQRRFDRAFAALAHDPHRHPNIKPLRGRFAGCWRFRVGDYRLVYQIDEPRRRVLVVAIGHRRDVYE
jgi:mRNA interferase RelE/StbE